VALQLAIGSDKISADVVEIQEFPDLARKFQVRGVPMTILNDAEALVGTVPPMQIIDAVERAARDE
jgi:hypothetical protein